MPTKYKTGQHNPNLPLSRANPKIDLDYAIQLRLKGLSYEEIAKIFNVSKQAVHNRLTGYISENIEIQAFSKHKADILAGKQAEILRSLTEEDIKKASAYQRVGMFGILYQNERLERGLSTQNIDTKSIAIHLQTVAKDLEDRKAKLLQSVDNQCSAPVDNAEIDISD